MIKLTNINLQEIVDNKKEIDIEIPKEIAKFKAEIPNLDLTTPTEIPPTPMILTDEGIANIAVYTSNDLEGVFTRLPVMIYRSGGIVLYSELPSGDYKAKIKWPKVR